MKSQLTIDLEKEIWRATNKKGVFGCFEVTIGWTSKNKGRVDYLTMDTKGIWRCYEVKSSKPDFYSKSKHTFVGNYNYYVMPKELYKQVKNDIPKYVGVYASGGFIKNPQKQKLKVDEQILKNSMIRSLSRDVDKMIKSDNPLIINSLNKQISKNKKDAENYKRKYNELMHIGIEKYGARWYKD